MCLKSVLLLPLLVAIAWSQTALPSPDQSTPTFRSSVPVVLVDVIVTNNHGEPVPDLRNTDFQLLENGKLQALKSCEEHKSEPSNNPESAPTASGVFTNSPTSMLEDSENVLLIDGLNTPSVDQSFLHSQILKYLKTIPPGARVAVFTLTTRLRMLQEFTTDSSALLAAVNSKAPFSSPLLQSDAEQQSQQQTINFLKANRGGPAPDDANRAGTGPDELVLKAIDPVGVLQQVFADTTVRLSEARVHITLKALQDLANYLAPFPGRKNVMWVSGSFPIMFLANSDLPDPFVSLANFHEDIARTTNLLTSARVAIYPIAAQGLHASAAFEANGLAISESRPNGQDLSSQVSQDSMQTQLLRQSMEELAKDTGGQAIYDTNGIGEALARVTNNSAHFYTLSYTPSAREMDGKYRRISIKLADGKGRLSYRRGYFAVANGADVKAQGTDPLVSALAYGMPELSQIIYKVRLARIPKASDGPKNEVAGSQVNDGGMSYAVDLEVLPDQLQFEVTPDGVHHAKVELKLVVYDRTGKALSEAGGSFGLAFKPDRFEQMRRSGIGLRQVIDTQASDVRLYSGIRDLSSGRIGTLDLRMSPRSTSAASK